MKRICSALLAAALCLSLSVPSLAAEPQSIQLTKFPSWVFVDGVEVDFQISQTERRDLLRCNGTVYMPLMSAGLWLGADPVWEQNTKTVTLTSNGAGSVFPSAKALRDAGVQWTEYDFDNEKAQLCSDVTVTLDGQPQSFTDPQGKLVYPLLFQGHIYLPLRSIGALCGKQVTDTPYGSGAMIHLYNAPTKAELNEATQYLSSVQSRIAAVRSVVLGNAPTDNAEITAKVTQVQTDLKAIYDLPAPAFSALNRYIKELQIQTLFTLWGSVDNFFPEPDTSGAAQLLQAHGYDTPPQQRMALEEFINSDGKVAYRFTGQPLDFELTPEYWEEFSRGIVTLKPNHTTYFMDLERILPDAYEFLSAVTSLTFAPTPFTDAKDIQHWEAVATLAQLGVVNGKEDGSFDPTAPVTRAEAAKLITTMLAGGKDFTPEAAAPSFSDTQEHWAKDYIENCVRLGIISGRGDGTFAPNDQVSLYQLFKMTEVMLEDNAKEDLTSEDWDSYATLKAIRLNLYNGLVDPVPSYEQRPIIDIPADYPLTREEAAQVLFNALAYVPSVFVESTNADGKACWIPAEKTDGSGVPLSFLYERFGVTEVSVPAQPK